MKHAWISGALACGMLLIAVAAYTLSHWGGALTGREIIHQEESKYQNLYITRKGSRTLLASPAGERSPARWTRSLRPGPP